MFPAWFWPVFGLFIIFRITHGVFRWKARSHLIMSFDYLKNRYALYSTLSKITQVIYLLIVLGLVVLTISSIVLHPIVPALP